MFRPCIDLHDGQVKQIVGGTLSDDSPGPETNFVASQSPGWYAELYRNDGVTGGHVIKLGPGNEEAAREALSAYPGGLQLGGGVNIDNAEEWIREGASHVIVTSWVFSGGQIHLDRMARQLCTLEHTRFSLEVDLD